MILEQMSQELNLPVTFISGLAIGASHEYKEFTIPKRSGGRRTIYHPSRRLKALQRWLLLKVIEPLPIHDAAMAYGSNTSILENAKRHVNSRYLLRMDFQSFFESITARDIRLYISDHQPYFGGWSDTDTDVFCRLTCRNATLTIGAPTSPALSNRICFELDQIIDGYCKGQGITYTRYADDLFFSTKHKGVLRLLEDEVPRVCVALRFPSNLRINLMKTRHASKRRARHVTGIVLGSDAQAHIGRSLKRRIRTQIYRLEQLDEKQRNTLSGLIAYSVGLDPNFMNSLINKYGFARVRQAQLLLDR
ncbi:MAG TPA: retron St85 family RNA-directed DNA polymerase [Pyrinomonadaceae bacterium]|nr:retron St85 family RNA-directed DNA polymerase [Pyrinomonadaceae bacterium]